MASDAQAPSPGTSTNLPREGAAAPRPVSDNFIADEICIRAILAGERERFAELIERYQGAVFNVALSYSKDAHHAEDLAQEIFVNAFTNLAQLREPRAFLPWLLQIARNRAARQRSKEQARPEKPLLPEVDPAAPLPDMDAQRAAGVLELVEELGEPYRGTLLMKYHAGLSCKEIAKREGVPVGTITSRLTRALAFLRTALGTESNRGAKATGAAETEEE